MAMDSIGYPGTVGAVGPTDTGDWAALVGGFGATFVVLGPGSWRPGTTTSVARGVTVQPGTGTGRGVMDTLTGDPVVIAADPVASGTRYDTLVARRHWASKTTSFVLRKGGATPGLAPTMVQNPGVEDDQPIGLYAVTGATATLVADLRMWRGGGGGLVALNELVLQLIAAPGSRVWIGRKEFVNVPDSVGGSAWLQVLPELRSSQPAYGFRRDNVDAWPGGQWGQMAVGVVPVEAATPGWWEIEGDAEISRGGSGERAAVIQSRINGGVIATWQVDDQAGVWRWAHCPAVQFLHTGGAMTAQVLAQVAVQSAVRSAIVRVRYLGP